MRLGGWKQENVTKGDDWSQKRREKGDDWMNGSEIKTKTIDGWSERRNERNMRKAMIMY